MLIARQATQRCPPPLCGVQKPPAPTVSLSFPSAAGCLNSPACSFTDSRDPEAFEAELLATLHHKKRKRRGITHASPRLEDQVLHQAVPQGSPLPACGEETADQQLELLESSDGSETPQANSEQAEKYMRAPPIADELLLPQLHLEDQIAAPPSANIYFGREVSFGCSSRQCLIPICLRSVSGENAASSISELCEGDSRNPAFEGPTPSKGQCTDGDSAPEPETAPSSSPLKICTNSSEDITLSDKASGLLRETQADAAPAQEVSPPQSLGNASPEAVVLRTDKGVQADCPAPEAVERARLLSVETHAPTPRSARLSAAAEGPKAPAVSAELSEEASVGVEVRGEGGETERDSPSPPVDSYPLKPLRAAPEGGSGSASSQPHAEEEDIPSDCVQTPNLAEAAEAVVSGERLESPNAPGSPAKKRDLEARESLSPATPKEKDAANGEGKVHSDTAAPVTSARRLVVEAGQSFRLKFLQHRGDAALRKELIEATDSWESTCILPSLEAKTFDSPAACGKQKTELCVLTSHIFSRSSNGSSLSLPSSRRCEACIAAACDRILADASRIPAAAARKLLSPARRGAAEADSTTDRFFSESTPTAARGGRKATATPNCCPMRKSAAPRAAGSQSLDKAVLGTDTGAEGPEAQSQTEAAAQSDRNEEKKTVASLEMRERSCFLPRSASGLLPRSTLAETQGKSRAVAQPQGRRSLSTAGSSRLTGSQSSSTRAPSARESVRGGVSGASARGQLVRQASMLHLRPKTQIAAAAAAAPPTKEKLESSRVAATAGRRRSASETVPVSSFRKPGVRAADGVLEKKSEQPSSAAQKPSVQRLKSVTRSRAHSPTVKPVSPATVHESERIPTSFARGRYPGERPPWDSSPAPRHGPRMPFRSLVKRPQL